jgi:hypothetical protein
MLGQQGLVRVGARVWTLTPGSTWTERDTGRGVGWDTDRAIVAFALTPAEGNAPEDRGLSFIDGARARNCRIALEGSTLRSVLPAVELLVGGTDISRWKGELEYWVFADGRLGQADGAVNGPATDIGDEALTAGVRFRLLAFDRGEAVTVAPPAP